MRFDALTTAQQVPVAQRRGGGVTQEAVDIIIPVIKPRGAVVASRHGTLAPLPALRPELVRSDEESELDFHKRDTNIYLQVSLIQPMLSTLRNIMENWFLDPVIKDVWEAAQYVIPVDALTSIFKLKGLLVTPCTDVDSEASEEEEEIASAEDPEISLNRKAKKAKKESKLKAAHDEKLKRFKDKMSSAGEWPAIFSRSTAEYKACLKRYQDIIELFRHFLEQDRNCKLILATQVTTDRHIHQFLSFVSKLSLDEVFSIGSLSALINRLPYDEHPLMQSVARIVVTIGIANTKSEKGFSAMGLIKTVLRSCMEQSWFNDLSFISINRFINVNFETFLSKMEELYPNSKVFQ